MSRMRRDLFAFPAAALACAIACAGLVAAEPSSGADRVADASASSLSPGSQMDELAIALERWVAAADHIETLECRFMRYEYDTAREIETRGQGMIRYESGARAMYRVEPYPPQQMPRSSRASSRGEPYELAAAKGEILYWLPGQVARINSARREYELFEVPERFRSNGVILAVDSFDVLWTRLGCLERNVPGLIAPAKEDLHQLFEWSLVTYDETQVVLKGLPLTAAERRHCSSLIVYVDPKTWLTRGTRTVDPSGSAEVLHVFSEMKVNTVPASDAPDWAPNLGQLRLLTPPPLAPPATE